MNTSYKQMRCRCGSDHTSVMRAIRDGREMNWSRGAATAFRTLRRWGCITDGGELTGIGKQLIDSFDLPARKAQGDGSESSAVPFDSVAIR